MLPLLLLLLLSVLETIETDISIKVDKKDLTSSDPYLKMARVLETGEQTYIFKTEVQSRTLNPEWRTIQVVLGVVLFIDDM